MSLIEVTTSLAILGSLLVATLVAKGKLTRQSAQAQARIQAIAVADELMQTWQTSPTGIPRDQQGEIPDSNNLWWRTETRPIHPDTAKQLGMRPAEDRRRNQAGNDTGTPLEPQLEIVRLEVYRDQPVSHGGSTSVLASVEVFAQPVTEAPRVPD